MENGCVSFERDHAMLFLQVFFLLVPGVSSAICPLLHFVKDPFQPKQVGNNQTVAVPLHHPLLLETGDNP